MDRWATSSFHPLFFKEVAYIIHVLENESTYSKANTVLKMQSPSKSNVVFTCGLFQKRFRPICMSVERCFSFDYMGSGKIPDSKSCFLQQVVCRTPLLKPAEGKCQ